MNYIIVPIDRTLEKSVSSIGIFFVIKYHDRKKKNNTFRKFNRRRYKKGIPRIVFNS